MNRSGLQLRLVGRRRQRGVALLTALTVVALATVAAVAMSERQLFDIRRTGNLLHADQAYTYALGGEHWARGMLVRDSELGAGPSAIDGPGDVWATALPTTDVDNTELAVVIDDAQGRFNLNNLYLPADADAARRARVQQQLDYFTRLLHSLDIDTAVAPALADWLDADQDVRFPGGAEDLAYLAETPPYRAANGRLADVSEIRLVQGIDDATYRRLAPFLSVLPDTTALNINTADAQLIAALDDDISVYDAQALLAGRVDDPYASVQAFTTALAERLNGTQPLSAGQFALIDVRSDYFRATSRVELDRIDLRLTSLLHRDIDGRVRVLQRRQGDD